MAGLVARQHSRSSPSAMPDLWIKLCSTLQRKCCVGSETPLLLIPSRPATSWGKRFAMISETSSIPHTLSSAGWLKRGSASRTQTLDGLADHQLHTGQQLDVALGRVAFLVP